VHYLKITLMRPWRIPTAVALPYSGPPLFSHRRADELLVLSGEAGERRLPSDQLEAMRCGLVNLQSMVEASGQTRFVAMIVPDKSTMYRPYLDAPQLQFGSVIGRLSHLSNIHLLPLEGALRRALAAGAVDVWLPNDSHWGSAGHAAAAEALEAYLRELGVFPSH
jgi:hypothetical protein